MVEHQDPPAEARSADLEAVLVPVDTREEEKDTDTDTDTDGDTDSDSDTGLAPLVLERVPVSWNTNSYVLGDEASAAVFDPGSPVDPILEAVGDRVVERVVLTHGHFDHAADLDVAIPGIRLVVGGHGRRSRSASRRKHSATRRRLRLPRVAGYAAGAVDYLTKPLDFEKLKLTLDRALEHIRLKKENRALKERLDEEFQSSDIIGSSPVMMRLMATAAQVAASEATVMVTGESGTGKELIAAAIHHNSPRKNGPVIKVKSRQILVCQGAIFSRSPSW